MIMKEPIHRQPGSLHPRLLPDTSRGRVQTVKLSEPARPPRGEEETEGNPVWNKETPRPLCGEKSTTVTCWTQEGLYANAKFN